MAVLTKEGVLVTEPKVHPRVKVVQPDPNGPLDRFEKWLQELGIRLEFIRPYAGQPVPTTLDADGLIVLGGAMSSNDDAEYPWLEDIRTLLRDAVARHRPTLGICLGGQLLAQALGGRVVRGYNGVEAGMVSVKTTDAAADDPLFGGLGPEFPVASMHGDMIEILPSEGVLLGSSNDYPHQAYRAAARAWGVQFHPEMAPTTYAVWAGIFESADPEQMRRVAEGVEQLSSGDVAVSQTSVVLATRFAQLVAQGVGPSASRNQWRKP